ncbi:MULTISPECIES: hypothetical protein [unclassified Streptomyces]|uniref:hypothetical protein n=1 Tax=unclassified Streptomyces TaxID=2593676 RepID=UPI0007020850|nr:MULTISPECIES: hypothetical protein [unclassified Streptomyces]KQX85347.1 hypothetical protein ASD26_28050 [Streptomyces sp. Root1319]KQZ09954.1 hypothetical protein ASD51_34105 [Streptomyces sp. Root55]
MEQLPTPAVQVPPGWPTIPAAPMTGVVQLHGEQPAIVYVPGPGGQMVAVLREHLPAAPVAYQPRDLTPLPLLDPRAQRLAAGGLLAGGVGFGGGQLLIGLSTAVSALAGLGTVVMWAAVAVVASRLAPAVLGTGRGTVHHHHTTVTTSSRWWGSTTTHVR